MSTPTMDSKGPKATIGDLDLFWGTNKDTDKATTWTGATLKALIASTPASSLTAGSMSIADFNKLAAMVTQAVMDTRLADLAKETLFHSSQTPANGTYTIFISRDGTYTLGTFYVSMASGTLTLDIKKNGVAIPGLDSIAVTSTEAPYAPDSTTTFTTDDIISLTVSSASTPVELVVSGLVTKSFTA